MGKFKKKCDQSVTLGVKNKHHVVKQTTSPWRFTVGSLWGSATASTGILLIFTKGCFPSEVVSGKNNQERHRASNARNF